MLFRRALITGISGSGGSYLADYILDNHPGVSVYGLSRWHSSTQDKHKTNKATLIECDLNDFSSVLSAVSTAEPDVIFHLAAQANVKASFTTPYTFLSNNILGTSNLLEVIKSLQIDPVVMMCSSSEVYGAVRPEETPIKETNPIRPASPYAVSKAAQDMLGTVYYQSYGMQIITTRMFSYINPRRSDLFASSFAKQIAKIEAGLQENTVKYGNLDSIRTLMDVRDAVEAYWEIVTKCDIGEVYNLGGDQDHVITVRDVLSKLVSKSTKAIHTEMDSGLLRPNDVTLQIPDTTKFYQKTDWRPKYSVDESLDWLLNYWRDQVRKDS